MRSTTPRRRRLIRLAASGFALTAIGFAAPAYAAQGSIDHVQEKAGQLQILYSIPGGVTPDLGTVTVSISGNDLVSSAERASEAGEEVRRTTVLAMDISTA